MSDEERDHQLSRRLIARAHHAAAEAITESAAMRMAIEHAHRHLQRSMGTAGSRALLTRALGIVQRAHPVLEHISRDPPAEHLLGNIQALTEVHGAHEVESALEAVLETMLSLLNRLIGHDMVMRLVDRRSSVVSRDDEEVR